MLDHFIALFFPNVCLACGNSIPKDFKHLCGNCRLSLPKTNYHLKEGNELEKLFWGRVEVESAAAFLHFQKSGRVQRIMHHFKYKGQKEIGTTIGELYAQDLKASKAFNQVDVIVPVPLHPKKEKLRGYNQSLYFAKGLAKGLEVPLLADGLKKVDNTASQTRKTRFQRWKNVATAFEVVKPEAMAGRKVLLVDDVLTTGATLEACGRQILKIPASELSILTMACA